MLTFYRSFGRCLPPHDAFFVEFGSGSVHVLLMVCYGLFVGGNACLPRLCANQVQYPGAERVMMSDLRNLKVLAWFLQKFELNFDILSSLKELSKQIKGEFDFRWAKALVPTAGCLGFVFSVYPAPHVVCRQKPVKETLEGYFSFGSSILLTALICSYFLKSWMISLSHWALYLAKIGSLNREPAGVDHNCRLL